MHCLHGSFIQAVNTDNSSHWNPVLWTLYLDINELTHYTMCDISIKYSNPSWTRSRKIHCKVRDKLSETQKICGQVTERGNADNKSSTAQGSFCNKSKKSSHQKQIFIFAEERTAWCSPVLRSPAAQCITSIVGCHHYILPCLPSGRSIFVVSVVVGTSQGSYSSSWSGASSTALLTM